MQISKTDTAKRISKFQNVLRAHRLDMFLISSPANIFYATNFKPLSTDEREAFILVQDDQVTLVSSALYKSQLDRVSRGIRVITDPKGMYISLSELCKNKRIGFEEHDLKVVEYEFLQNSAQAMVALGKQIQTVRSVKNQQEIEKIKRAQQLTQQGLVRIQGKVKKGIRENELAWEVEKAFRDLGADGLAFPPIVASGQYSGSPHHTCSDRVIGEGDIVLIDVGAKKEGYCGDITRTSVVGKPSAQYRKAYDLVKNAHDVGLSLIKEGVRIADVDLGVRRVFEQAGQLDHFVHTSGHGLGIGIHEYPSISYKTEGNLEAGMVITMEPGLYYDWGGIRIEDVVLVTKDGYEPISDFNNEAIK